MGWSNVTLWGPHWTNATLMNAVIASVIQAAAFLKTVQSFMTLWGPH